MKVKYLGTLFAASVLSLGLVTSCATPDGGQTEGEGTVEVNPCAGTVEVDPCAGAVEVDPCAGTVEVNPCAAQ
ncbi:MAG: hypothetical protein AAFQ41_06095 [Cyanobacteria bacterium J06623_7]